jgi:N-acetylglucosaminyl-diphospho-decaprenol L-rhamnosyltransferase
MSLATVIVPTVEGATRLESLLASLAGQTVAHEVVVVDNGSSGDGVRVTCERFGVDQVIRFERNAGFTRAINAGARRASGGALVLLNDDCVCDPEFVERVSGALDPARGVVMAAGVMRDPRYPWLIDTAGMELDRTLLVFDYLHGEPLTRIDQGVPDPIGPCAAAAAFDRDAFLAAGGFDERLFAYWEDVDLVLRLRRDGARCALAAGARGTHEHSATLGPGSARKDFLTGFGRGYVLRKWGVLTPRRLGPVLARDAVVCAGQAAFDRNLAGVRGRLRGYLAATPSERYPGAMEGISHSVTALGTLRRRAARRARLRRAVGREVGRGRPEGNGAL